MPSFHKKLIHALLPALALTILGCTPAKMITYDQQALSEADSLFKSGNYEYAKVKYSKIRDAQPESQAARTAQFYLGYINIFYDNPFANWEAALREFKQFTTMYPDDIRIGEVNSWIRILVVMQSFKKEYNGTADKLSQMKAKEVEDRNNRKVNTEVISESLRSCYASKDSIAHRVEELKNVIIEMERRCQQAGK